MVMTAASLRPAEQQAAELWDIVKTVPDPEVPVITIEDLGILRAVEVIDGTVVVTITPTYSGCPAMDTITADVTLSLRSAGYHDVEVKLVLSPAWTTDWMSEERSEEHTSELQSRGHLVCRLLLEKKKN